ncbi:MAG: bile acid:sodium symporter family protein [Verrucomicrobiota bacterium]
MNRIFLPLALVVSVVALWQPGWFVPTKPAIPWLLGAIMFGMGLTLGPKDFLGVFQRWRLLGVGIFAQYTLMPLLALAICFLLGFSPELTAGFVLLGACPGGTASNVIAYLARGNVALSVSMTLASTLLAPFLTPWITWLLAGHKVGIDVAAMMRTILMIVALPLGLGILSRLLARRWVVAAVKGLPLFSMLVIAWVIGIVMALNQERILEFPGLIITAVILHNLLGLGTGYLVARIFTKNRSDCRTVAIEVGMQNSGLAVALASQYLPVVAALPAALFSLWHNISGSAFASFFGRPTEANSNTKI